jgi:hypothetical protein
VVKNLGRSYYKCKPADSAFFVALIVARKADNFAAEMAMLAALYRDIIGSPYRPATIDADWLLWRDGIIPNIAQAFYDERRFAEMPILADALEEAGCTDTDILEHCRRPGEHVRGCWVVDLLIGAA